ncbi:sensor histidine kinase [Agromyces cerinus]|uniref:histidine kinase n=1 Tax=Agromyces cerinus subsp. cerinus TaxID=232089 RepID=A0A1N6FK88_9MICO|nr:histidine kinase [Agromyces cerinus]SIN95678.1 Signal transduction histidine kinase [Agromyces cerinus subsp. cerinus]
MDPSDDPARSARNPTLADLVAALAAAAALLPLTIVEVLRAMPVDAGWRALVIGSFVLLHAAVALRRRSPVGGLVFASVIMLALTAASLPGSPTIAVLLPSSLVYLVFVFTAAASGERLADAAALALGLAGAALMTAVAIAHDAADAIVADPGALVTLAGFLVASIGAAWALGRSRLELRRARAAREVTREQAAELRVQREREAAAEERRRLGRDLHDVVSHSLAVMVAQAEASRVLLGRDDVRARAAIEHVVATGRSAMADMRGLVSVLAVPPDDGEHDAAPMEPSPGLADLPDLVDRAAAPGRAATFEQAGTARTVSPGLGLTVYRVVQESLTNTLKHTEPPTRSVVRLQWGVDVLEVTVVDDGRAEATTIAPTEGRGIRGMRERTRQLGGDLENGPIDGGGWRTRLTLPLPPSEMPR